MKWMLMVLLLITKSWAEYGEIQVLEAPIFKSPSFQAPVAQWKRRGEKVFIHPFHFTNLDQLDRITNDQIFQEDLDLDEIFMDTPAVDMTALVEEPVDGRIETIRKLQQSDFYLTLDRNGLKGYIPKEFIIPIFNDARELTTSTNRLIEDPTDYRLKEPVSDRFPMVETKNYSTHISFGLETPRSKAYPYPRKVLSSDFEAPLSFYGHWLRKTQASERLMFGGGMGLSLFNHRFLLEDVAARSRERGVEIKLGPYFQYRLWDVHNLRWSLTGATYLVRTLISVAQTDAFDRLEERTYTGLGVETSLGTSLSIKNFFLNLDLAFELTTHLRSPQKLRTEDQGLGLLMWDQSNQDTYRTGFQAFAQLGFALIGHF